MTNDAEPAKVLLPYLQRADELQKHDHLAAYYCEWFSHIFVGDYVFEIWGIIGVCCGWVDGFVMMVVMLVVAVFLELVVSGD